MVIENVGVARTLISMKVCEEVKKDEPKLDADKNVKPKRTRGKSAGSKGSSESKRKRS